MKSNFAKLQDFNGGAVDFGSLSTAMNFLKMLAQSGCTHTKDLKEVTDIEGPVALG